MKRILSAAALLLLMAASTYAATLTFAWDPMPADQNWTKVRLYEKSDMTYTLLIEVAGTATQATVINVAPGAHSFVARSFDGAWESGDSNVVVTGPVPSAPRPEGCAPGPNRAIERGPGPHRGLVTGAGLALQPTARAPARRPPRARRSGCRRGARSRRRPSPRAPARTSG